MGSDSATGQRRMAMRLAGRETGNMISWQAKAAKRSLGKLIPGPDVPIEQQRSNLERMAKLPRARTATAEELHLGGVRCLQLTPTRSLSERHLLYFHGGGYVLGSPESSANWVQWLAVRANATVTLVDYRLAPEHPYPAAIDDCVAAFTALQSLVDPESIVLAGDSAGGGAALATMCRMRDEGRPLPVASVLFSPWTDLTASGDSVKTRADADPMINPDWLAGFADHYRGDLPAMHDGVSPLFADLSGLPPTLIQVGDDEVLLDDSTRLADRMRAAGVDVELDVAPDLWHVYQAFAPMLPESREGLDKAAKFMQANSPRPPMAAQTA